MTREHQGHGHFFIFCPATRIDPVVRVVSAQECVVTVVQQGEGLRVIHASLGIKTSQTKSQTFLQDTASPSLFHQKGNSKNV